MAVQFAFKFRKMWVIAVAEPVVVGIRLMPQVRARRKSLWGASKHRLGIGDVMNGGHGAVHNTDLFVNDLNHGSEAVGGRRRL